MAWTPAGYQVLDRRVSVPRRHRLAVAGRHLLAAQAAARTERHVTITTPGSAECGARAGRTNAPLA